MDKNILYPMFLDCKDYTLEPYFQDILSCCAKGKFPKGFRLIDNCTACITTSKGKEVYDLPKEDACKLWIVLSEIFRKKLNIRSSSEFALNVSDIKKATEENLELLEGDSWKVIKSKKTKDQLLLNFVVKIQKQHKLSMKCAKKLMAELDLHINTLRDILPEDISYNNGIIEEINGLTFEHQSYALQYSLSQPKSERISSTSKNNNNKSIIVEKYIRKIKDF